jgi:hypothetical protein
VVLNQADRLARPRRLDLKRRLPQAAVVSALERTGLEDVRAWLLGLAPGPPAPREPEWWEEPPSPPLAGETHRIGPPGPHPLAWETRCAGPPGPHPLAWETHCVGPPGQLRSASPDP